MENIWRALMLREPDWVITRTSPKFLRADRRVILTVATFLASLGIVAAIVVNHSRVTALSGANRYVFDVCPTGAKIIVHDWGDDIYAVFEHVGDNRYTIGYYPSKYEAVAVAAKTCNK